MRFRLMRRRKERELLEQIDWRWVIGPVAGAAIGYVTNDIAVRMLFRPHEEKRIFGRRVPFTPGLIAKERLRLSRAIRDVLDQDLLSAEVLGGALVSPAMLEKLSGAADEAIARVRAEEKSPRLLLSEPLGPEREASLENTACVTVREFMLRELLKSGIENQLATLVMDEAKEKLGSQMGLLKGLLLDDRRAAQYEAKLRQSIREAMETRGPDLLDEFIGNALRETLCKPVSELVAPIPLDALRDTLLNEYQKLVQKRLPDALRMVNLGQIVEDKLNAISMAEMETLILSVIRKELRAIVWLGALLGAVMGLVETVINQVL